MPPCNKRAIPLVWSVGWDAPSPFQLDHRPRWSRLDPSWSLAWWRYVIDYINQSKRLAKTSASPKQLTSRLLLSLSKSNQEARSTLMASSAPPPILPLSAGQPASSSSAATAPISTPAFRRFISRLSDSVRRSLANRRPWSELIDRSAFSRPDSVTEAASRVRKNLSYFRVNYLALLAAVLAVSLLSHPFSLLVLFSLLAAWCFLYLFRPADPPLVILGRTFSDRETLGALVFLTVLVIFLTSVGSLLISALMVGAAIVAVHGAFRVPEDLFLDEQDPVVATSGFLSFLGGAAASAGPAVGI